MIPADILKGLAALAAIGQGTGSPDTQALPGTDSGKRRRRLSQSRSADGARHLVAAVRNTGVLAEGRPPRRARTPRKSACRRRHTSGAIVPQNLVPHIRAAVAAQISNPADAISVDVIGLLFDYIFRDPAIPESTRALFGRLQVPIVKAALLDRAFFADKKHPARQLLDHLADAAVGAANDDAYRAAFEAIARKAIDQVCADFDIDVTVFARRIARCWDSPSRSGNIRRRRWPATWPRRCTPRSDEADRAVVRALLRDRLAGLDVPFEVRSFIETIWADYLAGLRGEHGVDSPPWNAALVTLDDMLWSIATKERTAQKARLSKMIPSLIGGLRAGCKIRGRSGRALDGLLRGALPAAHGRDQAGGGRGTDSGGRGYRGSQGGRGCRAAAAGERPRLRRRDGRWHVDALRSCGRCDRRAPLLGQPAAREIHLHQPLAFARVHIDAGGTGVPARQRHRKAGGRARAAVGPRGQFRARHARRAYPAPRIRRGTPVPFRHERIAVARARPPAPLPDPACR